MWQVDEAAAKLKMEITSKPQHLDEIDRKILQLEMERLSLAKVGALAQHLCDEVAREMVLLCVSADRHCDRGELSQFMPHSALCATAVDAWMERMLCQPEGTHVRGSRLWREAHPSHLDRRVCACVQAASADKTAKQRLGQLDAQLNELKKEQAELTKQWEREKVCLR